MKNLICTLTILFAVHLFSNGQVRLGIQAGGQSSTIRLSESLLTSGVASLDGGSRVGFHLGAFLDLPFGKKASLRPQVLYSSKGFQSSVTSESVSVNYLHIPVDLVFKGEVGAGSYFFGGGGYFSNALSGKAGSENLIFGSTAKSDLKESDFGIRVTTGYETEFGLGIVLFYEYGLANVNPLSTYNLQNRTVGLTLQYVLIP
jgi:hypothetical protein